ncbi:MAG: hypothetical protein EBZ48_06405 [Proteobacteria bacterium]|nr:hypothetical protein [Pseudomonadota bacterium]
MSLSLNIPGDSLRFNALLGAGADGIVLDSQWSALGTVAVKFSSPFSAREEQISLASRAPAYLREKMAYGRVGEESDGMVRLLRSIELTDRNGDKLGILVKEKMNGINLAQWIDQNQSASDELQKVPAIITEMIKTTIKLVQRGVYIDDLAFDNWMVPSQHGSGPSKVKLIEFGAARGCFAEDVTIGEALDSIDTSINRLLSDVELPDTSFEKIVGLQNTIAAKRIYFCTDTESFVAAIDKITNRKGAGPSTRS